MPDSAPVSLKFFKLIRSAHSNNEDFQALDLRSRPGGIFFKVETNLVQMLRSVRRIISQSYTDSLDRA